MKSEESQVKINNKLSNSISIMKKYFAPAMQVEEAQAAQMLAESLGINTDPSKTVDGGSALTKENVDWDIWGE